MKMNYLKKFGAVALAAVMAVTFAPVASLDAFAAFTKISDKKWYFAASDTITSDGAFVLTGSAGIVTISNPVKVTIDVKSGTEIKVTTKGATVVVTDSEAVDPRGISATSIKVSQVDTGSSVTLNGEFRADLTGADKSRVSYGTTAAKVGNVICVGDKTIAAENLNKLYGEDIEALNGDVNVVLGSGHMASVSDTASYDTTITATTDANTTLQKYETTYNFGYYAKKNLTYNKEGSYRANAGTFTDVRYYAGTKAPYENKLALTSDANLDGVHTDENDLVKAGAIFGPTGRGRAYVAENTNASNVLIGTSQGNDNVTAPLTGITAVTYTFKKDYTSDKKAFDLHTNYKGDYYTWDITGFADEGDAIALVDGDKYVYKTGTNADDQLTQSGVYPTKTYKLVQSAAYTKDDANKNANVKVNYYNPDVTLEAADDITIADSKVTKVTGKTSTTQMRAVFFGKSKSAADKHAALFDKPDPTVAATAINVLQLGKDVDSVAFDNIAKATTVDRASGIGYYRTGNTDDTYDYTFGLTDKITKKFVEAAEGKVNNGLLANPDFRDGTVFASKEIKTTVKGVNADVTMLGEISAQATATAADGSKTWEINLADTATNDKAVVAYRLYDGNRGEHIYTYNAKERDMLVAAGWKEETSDIKVLPVDAKTGVTVYRVYNPNNGGAHVFTTNPAEVKMLLDAGWEEGVAVFKTPAAGTSNAVPVYRVYNTGSKNGEHQFTTSAAEKDNLVNHGWKLEGTPWYSFK